jgi:hypothetical protein
MQQVIAQNARHTDEQRGVVLVADDELRPAESLRITQACEFEVLTADGATASLKVSNATCFPSWKPRVAECGATPATSSANPTTSFNLEPKGVAVLCEIARLSRRTKSPREALSTQMFGNRFDQHNGELAQ